MSHGCDFCTIDQMLLESQAECEILNQGQSDSYTLLGAANASQPSIQQATTTQEPPYVIRVVEMLERGIQSRIDEHGLLSKTVVESKFQLALTLRRYNYFYASLPRLCEVIGISQWIDARSNEGRVSTQTLLARHALRDSFAQVEGSIDELATRSFHNGVSYRGSNFGAAFSVDDAKVELLAMCGNFASAMTLFDNSVATLNFGMPTLAPSESQSQSQPTLIEQVVTVKRALILHDGDQHAAAKQELSGCLIDLNVIEHALGRAERDRVSVLI